MKLQYRVVKRRNKFYPHVRVKDFIFWGQWRKIAKHPGNSYGLYSSDNYNYGWSTFDEADQMCKDYNEWLKAEKTATVEVIPCNIK